MARFGMKLCENAFRTIPHVSCFDSENRNIGIFDRSRMLVLSAFLRGFQQLLKNPPRLDRPRQPKKQRKQQIVSKMKVQIVTINSVRESS